MKPRVYLYVVWQRGRKAEDRIRQDLRSNYRMICEYEIRWRRRDAIRNFALFYRHPTFFMWLRKCWICGVGPFRVFLVEDVTSADTRTADARAVAIKTKYRAWAGQRWRVHGSCSLSETRYQYWLLTGKTVEQLLETSGDGRVEPIELDRPMEFDLRLLDGIGA